MNKELIKRIQSLPVAQAMSAGDSAFSEDDRRMIEEASRAILGKNVRECSCKNRYSDALLEIISKLKLSRNMKEHKYMLKGGVVIWIGTDCYTRHNITDKVAKQYLKMHPDAENLFESIPEQKEDDKGAAEGDGDTSKEDSKE